MEGRLPRAAENVAPGVSGVGEVLDEVLLSTLERAVSKWACLLLPTAHPSRARRRKKGMESRHIVRTSHVYLVLASAPALVSLFLNWSQYPLYSGLFGGTADGVRPRLTPRLSCFSIMQPGLRLAVPGWISFPGAFQGPRNTGLLQGRPEEPEVRALCP